MFLKFKKMLKKEHEAIEKNLTKKQQFQNILDFAEDVITRVDINKLKDEKHPIFEVIHILGRKIHSDYMVRLLSVEDESDLESLLAPHIFERNTIITSDGKTYSDLIKNVNHTKIANLANDTIIPWPWKKSRLSYSILNIGQNRKWGPWKEDKLNHYLVLWLPIGLYWVHGGNHSLSVGIIQGNGSVATDTVYDISEIYNHVACDGTHFIRTFDNVIIGKVENIEIAAIFEIGRLMTKHNISYK
jgi:hypothetical protein